MFENVGSKIKNLVVIVFLINIIAVLILSISVGTMYEDEGLAFTGILIFVYGFFTTWLSCLGLYAFGELVDSNTKIESNSKGILKLLQQMQKSSDTEPAPKAENTYVNDPKAINVKPVKTPDKVPNFSTYTAVDANNIVCSTCNYTQPKGREKCFHCGTTFYDMNAPYWCGVCGHAGPYENFCPTCGKSLKIYNIDKLKKG